ncbi:MAG: NADP-dependent malic enzyme [Candidatus Moraniibacteriota bacterium]
MSNILQIDKQSLKLHRRLHGKIEVTVKAKLDTPQDLALAYTPGVAVVSNIIAKNKDNALTYTMKKNLVAVVTDGSAVLGLGNIGPEAALPVMEGKCAIFKKFAGIDAFPICLSTQKPEKIIQTVKYIAPVFSGINLEDIAAPNCFLIERKLTRILKIPVFHDDQHGTAIVVFAGLINALRVVNKKLSQVIIVINGAGAAGHAITKILHLAGARKLILLDSKGIISRKRDYLYPHKKELVKILAKEPARGNLIVAIKNADVFIGISKGGLLKKRDVKLMNAKPIIFALANPVPEISPEEAERGGAAVVATGRSDYPNQLNNALIFPGLFRGLLDSRAQKVTNKIKLATAYALAGLVKNPSPKNIIPSIFDKRVVPTVANAVKKAI